MASVYLKNRIDGSEQKVCLFDQVSSEDFKTSQSEWRPILLAAAKELVKRGEPIPDHWGWNWERKSSSPPTDGVCFFGIRHEDSLEGLMKVDLDSHYLCRLDEQRDSELVYVEYLETAPWNIPKYMNALGYQAMFSRVGTRLMQRAVQLSMDGGLEGRVGLHSLADAEDFYNEIGMTSIAKDPQMEDLMWFEFKPEDAKSFMEKYK